MLARLARNFSTLGERYSQTLFKSAGDAGELEKVSEDMKYLIELHSTSEDFKILLNDPTIRKDNLEKIMGELTSKAQFSKTTQKAIQLMTENKRLNFLPEVAKNYEEHMKARERKEVVKVVAAEELSNPQKKQVEAALKEFDKTKTYELTFAVDQSILGGLQLYFPTAFMDLSLKSRLDKIKDEVGSMGI